MTQEDFDTYFALYREGAFREAYAVLRSIMAKETHWSRSGDLYVWCAELELLVGDDVDKAKHLIDKARRLGIENEAKYCRVYGYVLWRMGEHDEGRRILEKSVELEPDITNLTTLGKILSTENDRRASGIWQDVLREDPRDCMAHIYLGREAARSNDRGKGLLMAQRAERLAMAASDFSEIARLYWEMDEYQSAINAYLEADRRGYRPKGPLYAAVAACFFSLGDKKVGKQYLDWAMKHNPDHEYVKYVYEESRRPEGGVPGPP
jgi:tetratricopeptide (TPR) repeat protein